MRISYSFCAWSWPLCVQLLLAVASRMTHMSCVLAALLAACHCIAGIMPVTFKIA